MVLKIFLQVKKADKACFDSESRWNSFLRFVGQVKRP